jgi:hypothetical protein
MARFRGRVQGSRGEATRLGTASSGLFVEANGWNFGIRVRVSTAGESERYEVYKTGGSHGGYVACIGCYIVDKDGRHAE